MLLERGVNLPDETDLRKPTYAGAQGKKYGHQQAFGNYPIIPGSLARNISM